MWKKLTYAASCRVCSAFFGLVVTRIYVWRLRRNFLVENRFGREQKRSLTEVWLYSSLIRYAIWSGRALSPRTKVTPNDNFRAGFKTLSFSQPVYSLFAADEGTNPKTAGRTAIENIALSLGTKVTTSNNFRTGFKTLSYSQPVYSLLLITSQTTKRQADQLLRKCKRVFFFWWNLRQAFLNKRSNLNTNFSLCFKAFFLIFWALFLTKYSPPLNKRFKICSKSFFESIPVHLRSAETWYFGIFFILHFSPPLAFHLAALLTTALNKYWIWSS